MIPLVLMMMQNPTPVVEPYLAPVVRELKKEWPANRTVNIVCHGHSVPAGYFATPKVDTFNAYPHLLHVGLKQRYPTAVVNVIVTAIGGENSQQGANRFDSDVLPLRPDVLLIDYGLNDRGIGLAAAAKAWTAMVTKGKAAGAKVILLTPTGDMGEKMTDAGSSLAQHAEQIRKLAREHRVALFDSFAIYRDLAAKGEMESVMSQSNHPNRQGHEIVAEGLLDLFDDEGGRQ